MAAQPLRPAFGYAFGGWLNRPRRILLSLTLCWVVAVFDLGYTLSESGSNDFVELNPVAMRVLMGSPQVVMAYKFGLLGLTTIILLLLRRYRVAELGCWFLLAAQVYVATRWFTYFDCLLHSRMSVLIAAPD